MLRHVTYHINYSVIMIIGAEDNRSHEYYLQGSFSMMNQLKGLFMTRFGDG